MIYSLLKQLGIDHANKNFWRYFAFSRWRLYGKRIKCSTNFERSAIGPWMAVKPPPPIGLVGYTGLDAALAMSKPQKSTQFLRLFTRGTETALTRKEDLTAKIRVKPNGESSVSLTFRYD